MGPIALLEILHRCRPYGANVGLLYVLYTDVAPTGLKIHCKADCSAITLLLLHIYTWKAIYARAF